MTINIDLGYLQNVPLPMIHNQSRTAPAHMPLKRHKTSKLPKAFCSGPCNATPQTPKLHLSLSYKIKKYIYFNSFIFLN